MKKLSIILSIVMATAISGCTEADFSENYANPSKVSTATVEKQFAGMLVANKDYVLPAYWNYFVVLRTTLTRYTQAVGWVNTTNMFPEKQELEVVGVITMIFWHNTGSWRRFTTTFLQRNRQI